MTTPSDYPLFLPPEHLTNKGCRDWNAKEATEYRNWLISVLEGRVAELTMRLEEPSGASPPDHLMALGEKAAPLLASTPFSEDSPTEKSLTNAGYALAADMGLLVAKYLLQELGEKLRWETIRKPKSELSYNLPVLRGFSVSYLDPIRGSTAEAFGILRGRKGADIWKRMYEFWVEKG